MKEYPALLFIIFLLIVLLFIILLIKKFPGKKNPHPSLKKAFLKSHQHIWIKMNSVLSQKRLSPSDLLQIEELLYTSDLSSPLIREIISLLKKENPSDPRQFLYDYLKDKMETVQKKAVSITFDPKEHRLQTIMIVGVNGSGKTTSVGKLASMLSSMGARVVLGAGDTFRAAAVEQLDIWCRRSNVKIVKPQKENAPPSAVCFDALKKAQNQKADFCLLDTAGRLHTKENLMKELAKIKQVLKKLDPSAPQHTLLVMDALSGQNSLEQAREFHRVLDLSGLIFTKCDSSSKAGAAVSITHLLQIPILYLGVGENKTDLEAFHTEKYLHALLGT